MLGIFGVGILGLLELMMILNDVQLPPLDNSFNISSTSNSLDRPSLASKGSENFVAYYNQGNAYYKVGDYEGAIDNYNQAIKLNPKDAQAYLNRGNADRKSVV